MATSSSHYMVYGTIVFVIVFCVLMKWEMHKNDITVVKEKGETYEVRDLPDKQKAAKLLAELKGRCVQLVKHLHTNQPDHPCTQLLVKRYKPDSLQEGPKDSKMTSYSVNKGEKIVFCIRSRDSKESLVQINTLVFVALHELAHVGTDSVGHTQEFWDNFRFLLKESISIGIYEHQDFKNKPVKYCGTEITDSPLDYPE